MDFVKFRGNGDTREAQRDAGVISVRMKCMNCKTVGNRRNCRKIGLLGPWKP